ncbi:MAG: carboxymuconolactone decarboxylase family protein [Mastigocoleus sp. MO_167.B18]|uniref:carboxymuconolactone decarboxylase family protein n=1 Tax=Mastigocoleus sp. MO_188.B34 TaxID=3036635 RepID=UPI002622928C|nr:carboxymuconolactone decarboxylase family protein [Mastigocoleus sp. MO_188.B34]MDJ0694225.1 carboxymuconolactone decarboxylase family protein [Mastigocoleus sp. MO_188.B34]MDJ0774587.1 carboxymuconolactone decarboxylase family protein [Mastigocoleus sp. MO_167.B18]
MIYLSVVTTDNTISSLFVNTSHVFSGGLQMQPRMEFEVDSAAYGAMLQLEKYVRGCGIDAKLLELIKIRASQINGCAFCIDMHTKDARLYGETEQRIYALSAWRETPFFTAEERAVLNFTEAVTMISADHISDEIYDDVCRYFTQDEVANILMAIITINAWNRIAITTRVVPGSYEPQKLQNSKDSETLSVN